MSKIHLAGICNCGHLDDLKELIEPLKPYYSGLQWVLHYPLTDGTKEYLEDNKKEGKIVYTEFCHRLDFSRNHFLYQGNMKPGDWFLILDHLEKLKPEFFLQWPGLRYLLESNSIDGVVLHGKRFLYKFNDFLEFKGNPHEFLVSNSKTIELTTIKGFEHSSWYFENLRPKKRDKHHFVWAYCNYMYNFPNSNHALLGLTEPNLQEKFIQRELLRREFRQYLNNNNLLPFTIEKFIDLCQKKLNEIKGFLNQEKVLNDMYRFYILKEDIIDDHGAELLEIP